MGAEEGEAESNLSYTAIVENQLKMPETEKARNRSISMVLR